MNPQLTMTRVVRPGTQFFFAAQATSRTIRRERPTAGVAPAMVDATAVDARERDRQEALTFLHRLVMG